MRTVSSEQYLLADGTYADPRDCKKGDDGALRHKNGVPVALKADGQPQTLGESAITSKNVEAAQMAADRPAEAAAPTPGPAAEMVQGFDEKSEPKAG